LSVLRGRVDDTAPVPDKLVSNRADRAKRDLAELPSDELSRLIHTLELEMADAAADLRFEYAARLRDEIKDLKRELRDSR